MRAHPRRLSMAQRILLRVQKEREQREAEAAAAAAERGAKPKKSPAPMVAVIAGVVVFGVLGYFLRHPVVRIWGGTTAYIGKGFLDFARNHPHLSAVMHVFLNTIPDIEFLVLAIAGLVYLMPGFIKWVEERRAIRIFLMVGFLTFALFTVAVNAINREEADQASGVQKDKLAALISTDGQLLNYFTSNKTMSEAVRRENLEKVLRNEYITSHDSIDPEILAGNKMPPDEWMNVRLAQLGEKWKFRAPPVVRTIVAPSLPAPPQPDITGAIVYPDDISLLLVNNSDAPIRDITGLIALWDLDNLGEPAEPLQIPLNLQSQIIAKHTYLLPQPLAGNPNVKGKIKKGDRIFGFITIGCAECVETKVYWVYAVQGVGGWYAQAEKGKNPAINAISTHIKEIAANPDVDAALNATVPPSIRVPIEQTVP